MNEFSALLLVALPLHSDKINLASSCELGLETYGLSKVMKLTF